ncbi:MAG: hypothetical protein WCO91_03020 [Gemmataceae bacterium]
MSKILKSFGLMVGGGLISGFLGGGFGALIGWISPEFVADLFVSGIRQKGSWNPIAYGIGVGAVVGLFVGFAAMVISISLVTLVSLFGRKN